MCPSIKFNASVTFMLLEGIAIKYVFILLFHEAIPDSYRDNPAAFDGETCSSNREPISDTLNFIGERTVFD